MTIVAEAPAAWAVTAASAGSSSVCTSDLLVAPVTVTAPSAVTTLSVTVVLLPWQVLSLQAVCPMRLVLLRPCCTACSLVSQRIASTAAINHFEVGVKGQCFLVALSCAQLTSDRRGVGVDVGQVAGNLVACKQGTNGSAERGLAEDCDLVNATPATLAAIILVQQTYRAVMGLLLPSCGAWSFQAYAMRGVGTGV